jgi:hypothetical protein
VGPDRLGKLHRGFGEMHAAESVAVRPANPIFRPSAFLCKSFRFAASVPLGISEGRPPPCLTPDKTL